MESLDRMRGEFEAWASCDAWLGIGDISQMVRDGDGYIEIELHTAWLGWKASRACLAVELPSTDGLDSCPQTSVDFDQGYTIAIGACSDALKAAGIKTSH